MSYKDPEQRRAYHKTYNAAHKEKLAAQDKAYKEANREKVRAAKKAYYEANKCTVKIQGKAYRSANKDKISARGRSYYHATKDKQLAYMKAYRTANAEKVSAYHRVRLYGISPEFFKVMMARQNSQCPICGVPFVDGVKRGLMAPHVDHDHETGQVRSLLCHLCNLGLGHFEQDRSTAVANLRAAADYLEFWYSQSEVQHPLIAQDV